MDRLTNDQRADTGVTKRIDASTPAELCAVLSRELRSPLSTIAGYLDLLANGGVGPVSAEQREFLDVVSRNVDRLTSMVTSWYEMSRIEAGGYEPGREPVDLEEIADRAIAELRTRIRSKAQQVTVEIATPTCLVIGDQRGLQRVVGILLSNAHKYTPPGGSIHLRVATGQHETVRFDVVDTGIGIRDEDKALLFRKFFRSPLTESEHGSGLGLTLAKALTEQMGAQLTVQSVLGHGSTFSIVLPAALRSAPELPADSTPSVACSALG